MKTPKLYQKYHLDKEHTSIGLFKELNNLYNIQNVFYPGSHVHITPSLVFPKVTYADSFKNTYKFFENKETLEYITKNKVYLAQPEVRFFQQDYNQPFTALSKEFDLVISQYAGFVGQAVKAYLKKGGLLVCNNSHGDASMASLDNDYKLIAVYKRYSDDKFTISDKQLHEYLKPKRKHPTKEELLKTMKGITYTKSPTGYIFEKLNH